MPALSSRSVGISQKIVPGDFFNRHFAEKEVGGVYMLEDATEDNNTLCILCFKDTDYIMKVMASQMTFNELEEANTKQKY